MSQYIPTEKILKECGFIYETGELVIDSYKIVFGDLELRYAVERKLFEIWEGDELTKEGFTILYKLNINSDTDLLHFIKIITGKE